VTTAEPRSSSISPQRPTNASSWDMRCHWQARTWSQRSRGYQRSEARRGGEDAEAVVEGGAAGDLGEELGGGGQPVGRGQSRRGVEAERGGEPGRDVGDLHAVVDRAVGGLHDTDVAVAGGREVGGIAVERLREVFGEDVSDAAGVAGDVPGAEEELEARAPFVVRGARGVEAEHLGTAADAGGGVGDVGGRFFP
jgi:hypothetical protein